MSDVTFGKYQHVTGVRDAGHLAVIVVSAGTALKRAQHVGIDKELRAYPGIKPHIGIVDPFLPTQIKDDTEHTIKAGTKFYLCLYPGSATGLRHVYEHPILDGKSDQTLTPSQVAVSEAWLMDFANTADCPSYDTLITVASGNYGDEDHQNDGEYLYFSGFDAHGPIPAEFWHHVSVVTGKPIPDDKKAKYFSCSC